jgi:hypothetical protein
MIYYEDKKINEIEYYKNKSVWLCYNQYSDIRGTVWLD